MTPLLPELPIPPTFPRIRYIPSALCYSQTEPTISLFPFFSTFPETSVASRVQIGEQRDRHRYEKKKREFFETDENRAIEGEMGTRENSGGPLVVSQDN